MADKTPEEKAEYLYEVNKGEAKRAHDNLRDFANKLNEAAVGNANLALRSGLLINGGAAVAMLAFIGGLLGKGAIAKGAQLVEITAPLIWFASGVAVATLGMGFAYFTNYCIAGNASTMSKHWEHPFVRVTAASKKYKIAAIMFQLLAITLGFGAIGTFVTGMVRVYVAIQTLGTG
jgi:hypothetical protein